MDVVARRREAIRLLSEQLWFALATIDNDGFPTVSYIPFATVDGAFGIVVSRLAVHSVPLRARRRASVLVVDGNTDRLDAYTRARLSIGVNVSPHAAGSPSADAIWRALECRHGDTARTLRALPDFDAISLEPIGGRLVLGFASAHDLSGAAIAELMKNAS
jgi:heme iron utilization protein